MAIKNIRLQHQADKPINTTLILGAGASYPLPTANDIKQSLVEAAFEYASIDDIDLRKDISSRIDEVLNYPFTTLEAIFALFQYRLGSSFSGDHVIENSLNLSSLKSRFSKADFPETTPLSLYIAYAMSGINPIFKTVLTSNFDDTLEIAHDILVDHSIIQPDIKYNIITAAQIAVFGADIEKFLDNAGNNTIVHFHGTVCEQDRLKRANGRLHVGKEAPRRKYIGKFNGGYSDPSTMFARGLARPFSDDFGRYLRDILTTSDQVVFYGYRGADEYDFNLILEDILNDDRIRRDFKNKVQWHSYVGDGSDLSPFVQNEFTDQIVNGNFVTELGKLINNKSDQLDSLADHARKVDEIDLNYKIRALLKEKLLTMWQSSGVKRDLIRDVLFDINNNVIGAWASMEHYYLESMGYDQNRIHSFGGARVEGQSIFMGIDFAGIVNGQRTYRIEQNEKLADISLINSGISSTFRQSFPIFKNMENSARHAMEEAVFQRDIDRAIALVGRAASVDYQGLILR